MEVRYGRLVIDDDGGEMTCLVQRVRSSANRLQTICSVVATKENDSDGDGDTNGHDVYTFSGLQHMIHIDRALNHNTKYFPSTSPAPPPPDCPNCPTAAFRLDGEP